MTIHTEHIFTSDGKSRYYRHGELFRECIYSSNCSVVIISADGKKTINVEVEKRDAAGRLTFLQRTDGSLVFNTYDDYTITHELKINGNGIVISNVKFENGEPVEL